MTGDAVLAAAGVDAIAEFAALGVRAFTTTRATGSFSTAGTEPVGEVMRRWDTIVSALRPVAPRFVSGHQVHGAAVIVHGPGWAGWLRTSDADGHVAPVRGTALAVVVADCVPVFVAHPAGAVGLLHSGWRGTAARIVERGISALAAAGFPAPELRLHLGPAICGACYEVSPEVYGRVTTRRVDAPTTLDLRAVIADQARRAGVHSVTASRACTRCDHGRFFSHRRGDAGRQIAVIAAEG